MNLYAIIVGSAAILIQLYYDKYLQEDLTITLNELEKYDNLPRIRIYDFIVVGGGAAGCVLANRLSKNYKILLLEGGGTPVPASRVHIYNRAVGMSPLINYIYKSLPLQDGSTELGRVLSSVNGKMLGGSTSHYGFIYNRGHPLGYDSWATLTNDSSWKYENILKYFKKSEHFIGEGIEDQHGHHGPMTIDTNFAPILSTWLEAGTELGFTTTLDSNGPQKEGFTAVQLYRKNGRRVSSYTAFIKPLEDKEEKLRIERYSEVSEILINEHKKAYGVAYTRHGIPQIAHASKEIIISCGPIGTPLLLMKSGIGKSNVLREAGIQVIADLPVGIGFKAHKAVVLPAITVTDTMLFRSPMKQLTEESLIEFHEDGEGILKAIPTVGQAFIVSSRAKSQRQENWPDLLLEFNEFGPSDFAIDGTSYPTITARLNRPKSKGVITLNTTAYKAGIRQSEALAIIDYKYFSEPSDLDILLEGIKLIVSIVENTPAFQKVGASFNTTPEAGCSQFAYKSDEYWRCYIKQIGVARHDACSCQMGFGPEDKNAVLDSEFNVIGISNLKVVDASSMRQIPNANIAAAVIMIAEKASDEILKAWGKKTKLD